MNIDVILNILHLPRTTLDLRAPACKGMHGGDLYPPISFSPYREDQNNINIVHRFLFLLRAALDLLIFRFFRDGILKN